MTYLIDQLDKLLRQHRPAYFQRLLPAATKDDLLALEQELGVELPPAFKALYLWKNGQPTNYFAPWQNNQTLMSLAAIRTAHDVLTGLLRAGEFDKATWWHPQWIPFLDNGGGDHFCIDLSGTFGGNPGQIVEFRHDSPVRSIVAPSFTAWLESYVKLIQGEDWEYYKEIGEEPWLDWEPTFDGYPIRAKATSISAEVNALEYARWELNDIGRRLGSGADYLDRGRPDPDQQAEIKATMRRLEATEVELAAAFGHRLAQLRAQNPAVVYGWVATHLAVLDEIITESRGTKTADRSAQTRIYVAEKTQAEWQEVRAGKRDFVSINWYFLKDYEERLMTKLPGLELRKSK